MLLAPPAASHLPSGLKARQLMISSWPSKGISAGVPCDMSHRCTSLSAPPAATTWLSGLKASAFTAPWLPVSGCPNSCQLVVSHKLTWALLPNAEAKTFPFGLNATSVALIGKVRLSGWFSKPHTSTHASQPPDTRVFPSGLNTTLRTAPPCPNNGWPMAFPVAGSSRTTVLSSIPKARLLPSGL